MTACERCWGIAFLRAKRLGGHQADHYRDLITENPNLHPEDDEEQNHE